MEVWKLTASADGVYDGDTFMTHFIQAISLKPTTKAVAAWGMACVNARFRTLAEKPGS